MSLDCVLLSCSDCDYNSKWKCNLARHVIRKHPTANVIPSTANVTLPTANVTLPTANVIPTSENKNTSFTCELCEKIFKRKYNLTQHLEKCKGSISNLECEHCNNTFASRCSKSRHMKICKVKKESELKKQEIANIQNITNNTINNIKNINNGTVNNINIKIIAYKSDQTELQALQQKHIDKITQKIKNTNGKSTKAILGIINQYADYSLDVPNNRYIVKKNLRSPYSKVHFGNNKWKHLMDSKVMPEFTDILLNNLQLICDEQKNKFMYNYLDELCSRVEQSKDETYNKDYALLLNDVKLKFYDLTKDTPV